MASFSGGFASDRFKNAVDKNFLCPICGDVLKDPVECLNQHYFCHACIKKHLETNAKSCPVCVQDLSEKTLGKPPRILTDYLNGLIISCDHSERGCTDFVQVSTLKTHVLECSYRPVVCTNENCGETLNQKDVVDHVTKACDHRLVHCDDCDEDMTPKKFSKHSCILSKDLDKMKLEWAEMKDVLGAIFNSVRNIEFSLADFKSNTNTLSQMPSASVDANVMVIGGRNDKELSSVEVLNPGCKTWTVLQGSMQESRGSAASVLYGNDVIVSGGRCNAVSSDTIERMSLVCEPLKWIPFPVKLPVSFFGHKVVVINNCLFLVGGYNGDTVSDTIYRILLHPPYTIELKCKMEEPVCFHGLQAFEDSIFIFGGSTTGTAIGVVDTVLSYNTVDNVITVMEPLPFSIAEVATVRWNDNVIIIGGTSKTCVSLDTVILYNMKENKQKVLPSMRQARSSCAATIVRNKIVVMGGCDRSEPKHLNSVECFDLDRQVWEELPTMNERRSEATAVVYAGVY